MRGFSVARFGVEVSGLHGGVVGINRGLQLVARQAQALRETRNRTRMQRLELAVQAIHQLALRQFGIEQTISNGTRLPQYRLAVFDVRHVKEIRAFIDKTLAVAIHHQGVGIRVNVRLAGFHRLRARVHHGGMKAAPVAHRLPADGHRHVDAVAGVVLGAAHDQA